MKRRLASWWLRLWRPEFCFTCDKPTFFRHEHVAHPHRPGRSQ